MDILYALDTSKGTSEKEIESLKTYLMKAVDDFTLSPDGVRIAFVVIGNPDEDQSGLLDYKSGSSVERVKAFIQNIRRSPTGTAAKSNLQNALRYADTKLGPMKRDDAEFVLVVISKESVPMASLRAGIAAMRYDRPDKIGFVKIGKSELSDSTIGYRELKVMEVDGFDGFGDAYHKLFKFLATKKSIIKYIKY